MLYIVKDALLANRWPFHAPQQQARNKVLFCTICARICLNSKKKAMSIFYKAEALHQILPCIPGSKKLSQTGVWSILGQASIYNICEVYPEMVTFSPRAVPGGGMSGETLSALEAHSTCEAVPTASLAA
jgi:hypothetical protein